MPPRRLSRFTFSAAVLDGNERLFLTEREPFRFQSLPDNRQEIRGHRYVERPRREQIDNGQHAVATLITALDFLHMALDILLRRASIGHLRCPPSAARLASPTNICARRTGSGRR